MQLILMAIKNVTHREGWRGRMRGRDRERERERGFGLHFSLSPKKYATKFCGLFSHTENGTQVVIKLNELVNILKLTRTR